MAPCSSTERKRIRDRFRATLAGLLELEVLRVKYKVMVETALGKTEAVSENSTSTPILQGQHHYWVDEDSFRLKLKRSCSADALHEVVKSRALWSCSSRSSEDLLHLCRMERIWHPQELQSRSSSGFCESHSTPTTCKDSVNSLYRSTASLKYSFEEREYFTNETLKNQPILLHDYKGVQSHFSDEAIPEIGFRSVADLYPDSHWPDVSDVLQPKVVLRPNYRSDLPGHQKIYRYPSPLHAVALQSPLYASHSLQNNQENNWRRFSGSSTTKSIGLVCPWNFSEHSCRLDKSTYLSSSLLRKHSERSNHFEKQGLEEVILKRARVQCNDSGDGGMMSSRPKKGMHCSDPIHKSKSFYVFQYTHLQKNRQAKQYTRSYLNI